MSKLKTVLSFALRVAVAIAVITLIVDGVAVYVDAGIGATLRRVIFNPLSFLKPSAE